MTYFQEWLMKSQTLVWLGLVCYLLASLWNGNQLRPATTLLTDVMFGLIMTSTLRRLYIIVFYFPLQNFFLILCFCETSLVCFGIKLVKVRALAYYLQNSDVNYLLSMWCKILWNFCISDSPSCGMYTCVTIRYQVVSSGFYPTDQWLYRLKYV